MAKRPVSALGNKRPVSEYARVAGAMGGHPRFKVRIKRNIHLCHMDVNSNCINC